MGISIFDSAIDGLKNLKPFAVRGFLGPKRIICVVSYWNTHIFLEDEGDNFPDIKRADYNIVHINMIEFCEMLYNGINNNLQEWVNWFCNDENINLVVRERKIKIRLRKLRKLINKKKDLFTSGVFFL